MVKTFDTSLYVKRLLLGSRSDEVAIRVAQKSHPRVKKRGRGADVKVRLRVRTLDLSGLCKFWYSGRHTFKIGSELWIQNSEKRRQDAFSDVEDKQKTGGIS